MSSNRKLPARIVHALIGDWQWQPPGWMQAFKMLWQRHPRFVLAILITAAALPALLTALSAYLNSLPKPAVTYAEAVAPGPTRVGEDDQLYPD